MTEQEPLKKQPFDFEDDEGMDDEEEDCEDNFEFKANASPNTKN